MDWTAILRRVAPRASSHVLEEITPFLEAEFAHGDIATALRQAHFFARAAVETAGFTTLEEFGSAAYFRRYDYRRDLGNVYPGDGARFHGRGVFQITGRANYRGYGRRIGLDLVKEPDLAAAGQAAVSTAILFWGDKNLNAAADRDDVMTICRRVNGGVNGLRDQKIYLARAKAALGLAPPNAPGVAEPPSPMPREQVRAVQQQLASLGYHMVGEPDGLVGSSTVAAISAFQHDKDLPLTCELDEATVAAIWSSDEAHPIPTSRAQGAPDDSRILAGAAHLKAGSTLVTAGGLATWGSGALGQAESAKSAWERVEALAEPFAGLRDALVAHPSLIVVAAAIVVGVVASRIAQARIEDYRTGRTP